MAKASIAAAIQSALACVKTLSEYDKCIISEVSKTCGANPGEWISALEISGTGGNVNWRTLLRQFVGQVLDREQSYTVPPRRFPHLMGIVPGTRRAPIRPKVAAVIDTCGSMSDPVLAEISKELARLSRTCDVVVVECDCAIHRVYEYKKPITVVAGRGGTSFFPPLERVFMRKIHADVMIFFTDGFGPAPAKKPHIPVICVLTEGRECPATWGKVVIRVHRLRLQTVLGVTLAEVSEPQRHPPIKTKSSRPSSPRRRRRRPRRCAGARPGYRSFPCRVNCTNFRSQTWRTLRR